MQPDHASSRPRHAVAALLLLWAGATLAASLERALMPGPVIQGHARIEDACDLCHRAFDRAAQPGLCMDCHKPVGIDVRGRTGFHGRLSDTSCSGCHTDHRGRGAVVVELQRERFDHARTDFALAGRHLEAACGDCHRGGQAWREAPLACVSCHRDDDAHAGRLGNDCAGCHEPAEWKRTRFDHGRTGFPLREAHEQQKCGACHREPPAKVRLDTACYACHRDDDIHRTSLGRDCAACHGESDWKGGRYDHRRTRFPLAGRHGDLACTSCHTTRGVYRGAARTCAGCHSSDDVHKGSLGTECATCHTPAAWRGQGRFDHSRTRFPLTGGHQRAPCADCHRSPSEFRGAPLECIACHRDDDSHHGRNGVDCAGCHGTGRWADVTFEHDRQTEFPLRGGHRGIACEDCHRGPLHAAKPARTCIGCHREDDPHRLQLGERCESCHAEQRWKQTTFDHDLGPFPLIGGHRDARCDACHRSQAFKDAAPACVTCHRDVDPHAMRLGEDCGLCHVPRDWRIWDFDHARRTAFALDGAHQGIACDDCHARPDSDGRRPPTLCGACHADDDVHEGAFGRSCGQCHVTDSFRTVRPGHREGVR